MLRTVPAVHPIRMKLPLLLVVRLILHPLPAELPILHLPLAVLPAVLLILHLSLAVLPAVLLIPTRSKSLNFIQNTGISAHCRYACAVNIYATAFI